MRPIPIYFTTYQTSLPGFPQTHHLPQVQNVTPPFSNPCSPPPCIISGLAPRLDKNLGAILAFFLSLTSHT